MVPMATAASSALRLSRQRQMRTTTCKNRVYSSLVGSERPDKANQVPLPRAERALGSSSLRPSKRRVTINSVIHVEVLKTLDKQYFTEAYSTKESEIFSIKGSSS